ncbi:hypothetical protein EDC01DRAFT_165840 [Geopyxis carbonaria]|nr:hypothetical protein EDC01DRAFT_165840 [Geopyxis carbonaria]
MTGIFCNREVLLGLDWAGYYLLWCFSFVWTIFLACGGFGRTIAPLPSLLGPGIISLLCLYFRCSNCVGPDSLPESKVLTKQAQMYFLLCCFHVPRSKKVSGYLLFFSHRLFSFFSLFHYVFCFLFLSLIPCKGGSGSSCNWLFVFPHIFAHNGVLLGYFPFFSFS